MLTKMIIQEDSIQRIEKVSEKIASTNDVHWHKIHGFLLFESLKKIKLHIPWRTFLTGNVSTASLKGWGRHGAPF